MSEMSAAKPPPQPCSPIEGLDEPLKELKDELQCPLCLDFYRDPVALPCQHSFCRECVAALVRPQGRDGSHGELECPLCRKKVHLDGTGVVECLPRNFHLGEIVGKFNAVETRLDVIRTEQLAKQQLQKQTSGPEQQQPHALHHQKQHEEPTGKNGQTQNQHQGELVMEQLQHLEQLELRQQRFHQFDGLHSSNDNEPMRANCAQPANIREHQGQQHRRQAGLGQQQLPLEVSQHGEFVQTLQEHLKDSFRQIREERHNQQRVLHQQLGQQREELHEQLHQQRQQQQNQQQKLHQQLGQQREGQKRNIQQLQQQLHQQRQQQRNQQQTLHQQLGQQREGQKRNIQQLQQQLHQQRQQQRNQQQTLHQQLGQQRERQKRNVQQLQQQRNQQQIQHQQHQGQVQLQQQQQQQGQRRAQQQQREHYHL